MLTTAPPTLTRDAITHRVLSLVADTYTITRVHDITHRQPIVKVRDTLAPYGVTWALTALDMAGLIYWYELGGREFADITRAGADTLARWDAELLGSTT